MTPSLTLFHGSRHYFRAFSNKYHYSGYGKMNFGWGVYFTPNIDLAIYICAGHDAMSYVWLMDGKKYYNTFINDSSLYDISTDFLVENLAVTYERLHDFNWKDNLLTVLESGVNMESYYGPEITEAKVEKYLPVIINRMKKADFVKIKPINPYYVYQVEIKPRRIFEDSKIITESQRKAFNKQLKRERRGFSIPYPIDWHQFDKGFYDYLERKFQNRYKHSSNRWEANRLTSLFLYRAGYDLMYVPYRDEHVLFDISRAKILGVEKVGL